MSRTSTYPCTSRVIRVYSCLARSYAVYKRKRQKDRVSERASERVRFICYMYVYTHIYVYMYISVCVYIYRNITCDGQSGKERGKTENGNNRATMHGRSKRIASKKYDVKAKMSRHSSSSSRRTTRLERVTKRDFCSSFFFLLFSTRFSFSYFAITTNV